jgi:endonuclease YncB( thermonuclease family)
LCSRGLAGGIEVPPTSMMITGFSIRSLLLAFFAFLLQAGCGWSNEWQVLQNCTLIPHDANDGDSFHVLHEGNEYIFRLYFADAPESKSDSQLEARIAEQAEYFGVDEAAVLNWGKVIGREVETALEKPFSVVTRFQQSRGRSKLPRFYAFVFVNTGSGTNPDTDLACALVAVGMARNHGQSAKNNFGFDKTVFARIEQQARNSRAGIWGANQHGGRSSSHRSAYVSPENSAPVEVDNEALEPINWPAVEIKDKYSFNTGGKTPVDMNQIFARRFPNGFRQVAKKNSAQPSPASSAVRVNLNKATKSEIESLPGIGEKTAAAIIGGRPYSSLDDLSKVPAMGQKKIESIAPLIEF